MKHLLAVGASSGLGSVFADLSRKAGDMVSVLALGPKQNEWHYPADLTDVEAVETQLVLMQARCVPVQQAVFFQRYRGDSIQTWDGELAVQLTATRHILDWLATFAALESAVFVSSAASSLVTDGASPGYHVAKAGLVQLARYYAVTLGKQGCRVNCVCPGTFVKPENAVRLADSDEGKRLAKATALGRMGRAEEVAAVIRFLLSDQASFVTGQSIVVDGGVSLKWQEDLI